MKQENAKYENAGQNWQQKLKKKLENLYWVYQINVLIDCHSLALCLNAHLSCIYSQSTSVTGNISISQ